MMNKVWRYVLTECTNRMYERDRQTHKQTDGHRMTAKTALDVSIARQKAKLNDGYAISSL